VLAGTVVEPPLEAGWDVVVVLSGLPSAAGGKRPSGST
jgi:hypothetical protein